MTDSPTPNSAQQYWEGFYRERDTPSERAGKPNELLVREAGSLAPGTALDLGCAEGGDAIWLAGQGWRVTATDVSKTALRRAAGRAAEAGLAERVDWQQHDLSRSFPDGRFDLVSAQFLHSPVEAVGERTGILRRAAQAVAPGGVLLIVGHAGWPSWQTAPPFDYHFPTTGEVLASLALEPGAWHVEIEELLTRELPGPDGRTGTRADNVLKVRRGH
ncbi:MULTISPECIES: class I SAM-dependent methyltransferase [unclassified Streptomyces]|uniref:class I SAM-dependent methyltransferase n=1 Tax=unclassified Streptomyces TaxID=2593676 RepID=UPI00331D7AB3